MILLKGVAGAVAPAVIGWYLSGPERADAAGIKIQLSSTELETSLLREQKVPIYHSGKDSCDLHEDILNSFIGKLYGSFSFVSRRPTCQSKHREGRKEESTLLTRPLRGEEGGDRAA